MAAERTVDLTALLARLPGASVTGDTHLAVASIATDSRTVRDGALFVALAGSSSDGHAFAAQAIANGARVVVADLDRAVDVPDGVTLVRVPDTRRALSALASAFYGEPSQALDAIGVTGTNGKTTTTRMIAAILSAAGIACGIVGTVGAEFGTHRRLLANTTPLPPELHELLAEMRDQGAAAVAMEVSSHALALDRVTDVRFRVAVLTNVTRDHLDFHGTPEAYAAAKRRLFDLAPTCVFDLDDEWGARWAAELRAAGREVLTYGTQTAAQFAASDVTVSPGGSRFIADGQAYELRIPGRFNVSNALAAIAATRALGVDGETAARGLAALDYVPGRMERVGGGAIDVVVDYAHTPDALDNALRALRETARGDLAVVFGCGGDRDRGKRPQMGAVAARLADRIYVTNDNPRSEAPRAIAEEIAAGIGSHSYCIELDRRRAIERAIAEAREGDVVLIAGKGHESYQIVGARTLAFDDAATARQALRAREVLR